MTTYKKVSIVGAGSWGTTLGVILSRKGVKVYLHSLFVKENLDMQKHRENRIYLKGIKFPEELTVEVSLKKVLDNEVIVVAIPVKFLRQSLKIIKKNIGALKNKIFVSVSKGIEEKTFKTPSQIIREEIGKVKIAVLSGPTIAREVIKGIPTVCVISSSSAIARNLQVLFNTENFRVYLHRDLLGVELGGALKNIIALACGISDGLGFGTNTKAALVNRGLAEMVRLGKKLGAKPETFWGITGLGDLITTSFSSYSRNHWFGEELGRGKSPKSILLEMKMVAEGVYTAKSTYQLSKKLKVDMPITEKVYQIIYKNKSPLIAVRELMQRPLKEEKL